MVKWHWKSPRIRKRGFVVLGLCWLVLPLVRATAEEAAVESPPKSVTLDQLLTLPSGLPVESGQYGGLTRGEWSSRFANAKAEVETAKADLAASLDKLSELVGKTSNWKVGAPGGQAAASDNGPVDYGLKQEIRRKREGVERAERNLRNLVVEANLAGVPEDWQETRATSE